MGKNKTLNGKLPAQALVVNLCFLFGKQISKTSVKTYDEIKRD